MCKTFLSAYNNAEIIKIERVFPELWCQMYCHVFFGPQCITEEYLHSPVYFCNKTSLSVCLIPHLIVISTFICMHNHYRLMKFHYNRLHGRRCGRRTIWLIPIAFFVGLYTFYYRRPPASCDRMWLIECHLERPWNRVVTCYRPHMEH